MRIDLLGTSFTLHSDEDPEYVEDLVRYVRSKIAEISGTVTTRDNLKIAILVSILLADELFKQRDGSGQANAAAAGAHEEVNRITDSLISRIDALLPPGEER